MNVIIDLTDPKEKWQKLGHGYQVEVRVVLWENNNVLKVPMISLFREEGKWAVFAEHDSHAKLKYVEVGQHNEFEAEILEGLTEGDKLVLHPSNLIYDNVKIRPR